jgi:hypothetical protein
MRTGSEGLSTRGRVRPNATGRRVAVFRSASTDILALIALAGVGRHASSTFRVSVMAGPDPAIHENTKSCNQGNDNVT